MAVLAGDAAEASPKDITDFLVTVAGKFEYFSDLVHAASGHAKKNTANFTLASNVKAGLDEDQ